MPLAESIKKSRIKGNKRNKGETVRLVLCLLHYDPILPMKTIAKWINVSVQSVYAAMGRIRKEPAQLSALSGIEEKEITWLLNARAIEKSRRRDEKQSKKKARVLRHGDQCPSSLLGVWPDDPRWPKDQNGRPIQLLGWRSTKGRYYFAPGATAMGYADPDYPVTKPREFRNSNVEKDKTHISQVMREEWS